MDVAAAGQASAQVSAAQRAQQVSLSALRSSQLQAQSIASVLQQSADATNPSASVQPTSQPNAGSDGGAQNAGTASRSRGSLVNILV
jgi:hypothetical protein